MDMRWAHTRTKREKEKYNKTVALPGTSARDPQVNFALILAMLSVVFVHSRDELTKARGPYVYTHPTYNSATLFRNQTQVYLAYLYSQFSRVCLWYYCHGRTGFRLCVCGELDLNFGRVFWVLGFDWLGLALLLGALARTLTNVWRSVITKAVCTFTTPVCNALWQTANPMV